MAGLVLILAVAILVLLGGTVFQLPWIYLSSVGGVVSLWIVGAMLKDKHVAALEKKTELLIGKREKPFPIKTKLPISDAVHALEKGLQKRSEADLLWTVIDSDPDKGIFRAYAYTYHSYGGRNMGFDKYVYMNVKFRTVEDETEVEWFHSFSPTVNSLTTRNYWHPSTFATSTAQTERVMDKGNIRIREIFGAETITEK